MKFIDTHVHLNLGHYQNDRPQVIQRAVDAGIIRMISSGVTLESSRSAIDLAEAYPDLFFCGIGIHPQEASDWTDTCYDMFKSMAQHVSVLAIGETGLDYFKEYSPKETQQTILRHHIQLARELKLPLIIHVRDQGQEAYTDLLQILKEEKADEVGGVMHCFSGNLEFAQTAIALNFHLGFGGVITFKNARDLQDVARQITLEHIILETDCPWLTPHPYRGQRNEPAYVVKVGEKIAELQNKSLEAVAEITTRNAEKLFGFKK